MMTQKKKNKPVEFDIHLKYLCQKCGQDHWLSFKESSTFNFKIVCDCGYTFKVKRTVGFKIKYSTTKNKSTNRKTATSPKQEIPVDLLNKSAKIVISYGFTMTEAKDLIQKSYASNPVNNVLALVKQSLELLGAEKNGI